MAAKRKYTEQEIKEEQTTSARKSTSLIVKSIVEQKLHEFGLVLHDEFERQVYQANAEIRTFIIEESRARRRMSKAMFALFGLVVILLTFNTYLFLKPSGEEISTQLKSEFSSFEQRSQDQTKSILVPMKENVEQNLSNVASQLEISRSYIDVYALEGFARNGSRSAFEELLQISLKGGERGRIAKTKIDEIKQYFNVLSNPKKQNLTLGEVSVIRDAQVVSADSLSDMELLYVMNSTNASIAQIHHLMTLLWKKELTKDMENEYWSVLQSSRNLPACIAVCSILKNKFGERGSIYDFAKWKRFLEERVM